MRKILVDSLAFFFFLALVGIAHSPTYAQSSCSISISGATLQVKALDLPCKPAQKNTYIASLTKDAVAVGTVNLAVTSCTQGDKTNVTFTFEASLGNWPKGLYSAIIYKDSVSLLNVIAPPCVLDYAGDGGGVGPGFKLSYCDPPTNTKLNTAIGCIPTTAAGFVSFFLGYLLGIAGVVAFFLILVAGFQILTSAGNPEKLEGAKQLLTAAVIGLFFIILSVLFLQIIGYQILDLPGFVKFER